MTAEQIKKKIAERIGNGCVPEFWLVERTLAYSYTDVIPADTINGVFRPNAKGDIPAKIKIGNHTFAGRNRISDLEFENKPMTGFGLHYTVEHDAEFALSSVAMQMLHPLGFVFNIDKENYDYIIDNYIINRGMICELKDGEIVPAELTTVWHDKRKRVGLYHADHPIVKEYSQNMERNCEEHKDLQAQQRQANKKAKEELDIGEYVYFDRSKEPALYMGKITVAANELEPSFFRMHIFVEETKRSYTKDPRNTHQIILKTQIPKFTKTGESKKWTTKETIDFMYKFINGDLASHPGIRYELSHMNSIIPLGAWPSKPKKFERKLVPVDFNELITDKDDMNTAYQGQTHISWDSNGYTHMRHRGNLVAVDRKGYEFHLKRDTTMARTNKRIFARLLSPNNTRSHETLYEYKYVWEEENHPNAEQCTSLMDSIRQPRHWVTSTTDYTSVYHMLERLYPGFDSENVGDWYEHANYKIHRVMYV